MIEGAYVTNRQSLERFSCSFDREELRRFLSILQERLDAAAELEVSNFQQLNQPDEEFENNKTLLRSGFKVRPTLTGQNGQQLYGSLDEIFDSPNFPEAVRSIYVNSEIYLKARYNYTVRNSFEMFLDFSRPEIFDFTLMPSDRTPNGSNVKVNGSDATWVNGVFHEIQQYINDHKAQAPWLHRHTIYDILLWFIGYPIAFWVCFKVAPFLPHSAGPFLRAALFVYLFVITLVGFRALFHYSRWVFPAVEYRHPRSNPLRHRIILGALSFSLIASVVYDILKGLIAN